MPFAFLESFHGVAFFGLDEMHFLGHGVAQQFWRLICGEFQSDGDEQHVFALRALQPETIGQLIEESRGTIPVAFQGTWKNVAKYSRRYRAVDWIDFLMHVAPTVILDNLRHEDTKRAAFSLLRACSIALQWHLTEDDIRQIERYVLASSFLLACLHCIVYSFVSFRCVQQWHQFLRREVNTGKLSVAGFTANQHYLRHMSLVVRALGPLRAYSARPLERAIGQYSKMIRSRSRPGAQASNVMYKISAIRYAQRTVPAMRKQASLDSSMFLDAQTGPSAPQIWTPFTTGSFDGLFTFAGIQHQSLLRVIKQFWLRASRLFDDAERALVGEMPLRWQDLTLDTANFMVADRLWKDSIVFQSLHYQAPTVQRANHFVRLNVTNRRLVPHGKQGNEDSAG